MCSCSLPWNQKQSARNSSNPRPITHDTSWAQSKHSMSSQMTQIIQDDPSAFSNTRNDSTPRGLQMILAKSVEKGLCGTEFPESDRNKRRRIQNHIDRHLPERFPERFPCGGSREHTGCNFVTSSAHLVIEHNLQVQVPYKCPCCKRCFAFPSQVRLHVDGDHV
jgi:hypothetical protein